MADTFSQSVMSALDAFGDDFSNARASTGGPQRPPNGDWDMILDDIIVDGEAKFRYGQNEEMNATSITFSYKVLGGNSAIPNEMTAGQQWPGKPFILPAGGIKAIPTSVSKGKIQSMQISLQRLKGPFKTLLGDQFNETNIGANVTAAGALIAARKAASSLVAVRVHCKVEAGDDGKVYFEEYLQRRIA